MHSKSRYILCDFNSTLFPITINIEYLKYSITMKMGIILIYLKRILRILLKIKIVIYKIIYVFIFHVKLNKMYNT